MSEILKLLMLNLLSEECFDKYFYEFDFFNGQCFKSVLSKGLGIGIILGSLMVKVPQILKIIQNQSAKGINFLSVTLDLFAITCHMSYSFVRGFPFSAWGEGTFLAIQTAIIAFLVLFYGGLKVKSILFITFYLSFCFILMSGITPVHVLWSMQALNIPVLITGKLSQAWTNYNNKSTGQLSAVTCFMLFGGALARIFTSINETGDFMMILTYVVSSAVNALIVGQLLLYWNTTDEKVNSQQSKKLK